MYRHGLRTPEIERLNTIHMDDMINMLMFTIEATSSHAVAEPEKIRSLGEP
jgi:hypothetical protein